MADEAVEHRRRRRARGTRRAAAPRTAASTARRAAAAPWRSACPRRCGRRRAWRRRAGRRRGRAPRAARRPRRRRRAARRGPRRTVRPSVVAGQRAEQRGVGVAQVGLDALGAQRVEHAPAGAQRDVALVRQAAGQDEVARGAHAVALRPGPGAGDCGLRGAVRRGPVGPEGAAQLDLLLQDGGQPAHALADAVGLGVAVGQAQVAAAGAVGEERRAGDERDAGGDGARQQHLGVELAGQRDPDVEAAGGVGPGGAVRHLLRPGRRASRRAARGTCARNADDLPLPVLRREVLGDRQLVERRRAQHRGLGRQHELLAHGVRREHPADAQAGREGLAERAEVEDVVLAAARADRRRRRPVEAEQAVGVVLEHQQAGALADREHLVAARLGQGRPGRVVEVRDGVEELRALAGRLHRRERLAQRLGHQPVLVHRDVHDLGLVGREGAERADVGRRLGDHDVTRVDEDAGDQVERLLAADGDDDVLAGGRRCPRAP